MFESGQVEAIDVSNCDPDVVIENLGSNNTISIVVQDIGKEAHEDYSDKFLCQSSHYETSR